MKRNKVEDLSYFDKKVDEVISGFKDSTPMARKTKLSAFFIMTRNKKYQEAMMKDCTTVNDHYKLQKKSDREEINWIDHSEIKAKYDALFKESIAILKDKIEPRYGTVIKFLALAFEGGVSGLVPRRSMDFCELKIKNVDKKVDNYYDAKKGWLIFNKYKTVLKYGMQTIDLAKKAPELNAFLKKWIKVNPTEYMLYSTSKTQIHSLQFARLLNSIFDKQISTDMLRHMFFTNHFANRPMPSLEEMTSSATEAATSLPVMLQYIKKE